MSDGPVMREAIADAARQLAGAGVPSPRHDAEALAAHVLGVSRAQLVLVDPDAFTGVVHEYETAVARRAAREPLQHLTGRAPFRHLDLEVGPGVLIPRPETELLVDAALDWLRSESLTRPRVVDLGTGSGAISLAIAQEWPGSRVWAVERDPAALSWAARNIAASGLAVELVAADLIDALGELDGTIDLCLSNPPYLPTSLRPSLEPEVRDHDPSGALFAGPDPLSAIRAVAASGLRLLRPGGLAIVEHGADQGDSAPACFSDGWKQVHDRLDLAGRPRYLTAVHI